MGIAIFSGVMFPPVGFLGETCARDKVGLWKGEIMLPFMEYFMVHSLSTTEADDEDDDDNNCA